jgi:UDP-glucose 4-epimerase
LLGYSRVLVTGGAGFIGSHLVDRLVEEGAEVMVIDNLRSGRKENLKESMDQIEFFEGDVRDRSCISKLLNDVEVVFHLAANASVPFSVEDPVYDHQVNVLGTFNVLESSRKGSVKKVVYASSAAVYGEAQYTPMDEKHPLNPISPYGASKLSGELIGHAFDKTYGLPFVSLRIFNMYGPRQRKYVMYDFIRKLSKNAARLEVLGDGEQVRTFCYVSDGVEAFLQAAESGRGVYNLGTDRPKRIKDLAKLVTSKLSPQAEMCYTGTSWKGDIQILVPDISRIEEIGFAPKISLEKGLVKLIHWCMDNEGK